MGWALMLALKAFSASLASLANRISVDCGDPSGLECIFDRERTLGEVGVSRGVDHEDRRFAGFEPGIIGVADRRCYQLLRRYAKWLRRHRRSSGAG